MDFVSADKAICRFISEKVKKAGAKGAVVGLSGGVDSAVVAALASRALGGDNVIGIMMPSQTNSQADIDDAKLVAGKLGIKTIMVPIRPMVDAFQENLPQDKKAIGNLTARVRMSILYYYANHLNYLVAGTGNKSEISIGYFTKYGDGGSDLLPIGDLYKTQVKGLAAFLGIPKKVIDRVPTAGLWPGQTDEGEIGMSYADLDSALAGKSLSLKVHKMVASTEHKRKPPEVCKLQ